MRLLNMYSIKRFLKAVFLFLIFFLAFMPQKASAEVVDGIVAVVNDDVITQGDINEVLIPIYSQYKATYSDEQLIQKLQEARKDILLQMIEDKLIIQEAEKLGVSVSDEEVQDRLEQIKGQFMDEAEFQEALRSQGITLEQLKEKYRQQLIIKKLVNYEVREKVDVTPTEVAQYYQQHRQEFKEPAQVKVRTILIRKDKDEADDNEAGNEKARVRMELIKKQLELGDDFSKLAKEYSEDPTAIEGGDMGYIKKGQMMSQIDEVIFSLDEGRISDVVETNVGYHIFMVTKKKPSSTKSFDQVRSEIEDIIFQQKAEARFNEWMDGLKEDAYISIK